MLEGQIWRWPSALHYERYSAAKQDGHSLYVFVIEWWPQTGRKVISTGLIR